jgi:hypothetical protein
MPRSQICIAAVHISDRIMIIAVFDQIPDPNFIYAGL